jgi:hypothetical protein
MYPGAQSAHAGRKEEVVATPEKRTQRDTERSITRTYRAAIRLGEDFITLEETVTLPIDASDEEVTQAVDLGWRIYKTQRGALESQVASIRESAPSVVPSITFKDPDSPASEKQRGYIATLQEQMTWTPDQLSSYAHDQQVDLLTLTKGQASAFIDGMKKLAEERGDYDARSRQEQSAPAQRSIDGAPVNDKQIHALERIAQQGGLDLDAESRRRYGVVAHGLTVSQASALLKEWQRPARREA